MISFDGPSGVGKTGVAAAVACRLGLPFVSVGDVYRTLAIAVADGMALTAATERLVVRPAAPGRPPVVTLDGRALGARLLVDDAIEGAAARLARQPGVWEAVSRIVRSATDGQQAVVEGRTSYELADGNGLRFFLWADPAERARRLHAEKARHGWQGSLDEIGRGTRWRDGEDARRVDHPLRLRSGMIFWDSSGSPSQEETVDGVCRLIRHHQGTSPLGASVVIPAGRRRHHAVLALEALSRQDLDPSRYEVLVVRDSGADNHICLPPGLNGHVLETRRRGAAAARNLGLAQVQGDVVIFLDGDMLVGPDFLRRHLELHGRRHDLVLSGARRHLPPGPEVPTSGSRRDSREAILDRYSYNLGCLAKPWSLAYSCNLSLWTRRARDAGGFDEHFVTWGLEDLEFAYRCHQQGARFGYSRRAGGHHLWHDRSLTPERYNDWSTSLRWFVERHPTADVNDLGLLAPAFDPARRGDFFAAYERFNGVRRSRGPQRVIETGAFDDALEVAQRAVAEDDGGDVIVVDGLDDEETCLLMEAATPGRHVQAYQRSDWERLTATEQAPPVLLEGAPR